MERRRATEARRRGASRARAVQQIKERHGRVVVLVRNVISVIHHSAQGAVISNLAANVKVLAVVSNPAQNLQIMVIPVVMAAAVSANASLHKA
jgi:hypothetical protein